MSAGEYKGKTKKQYDRERYLRVRHGQLARTKEIRLAARRKALEHYGPTCRCCGEHRMEFLAIDHVNGGGRFHRDRVGSNIAYWLARAGFPEGFRTLCHNCNQAVGFYGYCPHEKETGVELQKPSERPKRGRPMIQVQPESSQAAML